VPASAWSGFGGSTPLLAGNHAAAPGQGAAGSIAGARIDTGATGGTIGIDWTPAGPGATTSGLPEGLFAFRVQDANNYLHAGVGVGGSPLVGIGKSVNGSRYGLHAVALPPALAGLPTRRLEVRLAGAQIVLLVDGLPVMSLLNADYADASGDGLLWE